MGRVELAVNRKFTDSGEISHCAGLPFRTSEKAGGKSARFVRNDKSQAVVVVSQAPEVVDSNHLHVWPGESVRNGPDWTASTM